MSIFTIEIVIIDAPELACVVAFEGLSLPLTTPCEPTKFSGGTPQFFCGSRAFKIGRPHTKSSGVHEAVGRATECSQVEIER